MWSTVEEAEKEFVQELSGVLVLLLEKYNFVLAGSVQIQFRMPSDEQVIRLNKGLINFEAIIKEEADGVQH
jgi:hypothetical protein